MTAVWLRRYGMATLVAAAITRGDPLAMVVVFLGVLGLLVAEGRMVEALDREERRRYRLLARRVLDQDQEIDDLTVERDEWKAQAFDRHERWVTERAARLAEARSD